MVHPCLAHGHDLTCLQQKKAHHVAKHTPLPVDDVDSPPEHPRSPSLLPTKQKQKHQAVHNQLLTPGSTQARQTSWYRELPGANAQAHHTQRQPGTSHPSMDHQRTIERRRGEPATSQQEQRAVESRWTHIAKVYGMEYSPWITEPVLDCALNYTIGQDIPGDTCARDLALLLDECEIGDDVRKDKQFRSNVTFSYPFCILCLCGCI